MPLSYFSRDPLVIAALGAPTFSRLTVSDVCEGTESGRAPGWLGVKPATSRRSGLAAFSLIEIMVAVSLLSFIILGLVAMFVQTQRAFRTSMSDTDMLETGRALSDMMAREMTGIRPTQISNTVNFYVEIPQPGETVYTPPLYQALPGTNAPTNPQLRTNRLETFYFLTHPNQAWPDQAWVANGYYIVPDNAGVGIGSLYRYSNTNIQGLTTYGLPVLAPARNLFTGFANALSQLRTDQTPSPAGGGTVSHIADGIVHMSLRVFATNGFPIRGTGGLCAYWLDPYAGTYRAIGQTTNRFSLFTPDNWVSQTFYSNAVPAYVELELGVLDPQSYQRYKGIDASVPSGQVQFLSNRVAQVHIFRQRIPIRNVDPTAY